MKGYLRLRDDFKSFVEASSDTSLFLNEQSEMKNIAYNLLPEVIFAARHL